MLAPLVIAVAIFPFFPGVHHSTASAKGIKIAAPEAFTNPLAIPPVLTGANLTLEAAEADVQILPGAPTRMWTYNGTFPGPTIRRPTGQTTTITLTNSLPAAGDLTLHVHGEHTTTTSDGQPTLVVPVGQSRVYTYTGIEDNQNERGAMHWYHDHMMDMTGHNVWMGLAGMYIVDDPADPQTLPSGEFDVPLMVMDRSFDANNQLVYDFNQNGVIGNLMLVNGVVQPYFEVGNRKYRLRVLNASNSSDLDLALSNGQPIIQVGTESGLLPAPVSRQHILLGPAERADIIVDFSGLPGQNIVLQNLAGTLGTAEIMQFRVTRNLTDGSSVPTALRPLPDLGTPVITRTFEFGYTAGQWTINGQPFDANRVDAQPALGTTEKWILKNPPPGEWTHVIHLHFSNQLILSRNGQPPAPYELMKETWYLNPSDTIEILIKFTDYTGKFVFHCHVLEHEDDSMMGQFEVVASAPTATSTSLVSATPTRTRTATPTATLTPAITPTSSCATPTPTIGAVSIVDFGFNPQSVTIPVGSSIRWTNTGNRNHTSASDNGLWNSGTIPPGQTFTRVFTTVGSFPYHCNIHPAMTGTINVVAISCAANTPTATATATSTPTSTASSTQPATSTSIPSTPTVPTATGTSSATATVIPPTGSASPTTTVIPPSLTSTPSLTSAPIFTHTSTSTSTIAVSSTPTGTAAATFSRTPSFTFTPTRTNISTATSTSSATQPTGTQAPSPTACAVQFLDVQVTDTFYPYIRCQACRGIFGGYSDGTFRPGSNLTRGQAAKIVSMAAGFTEVVPPTQQSFNDVPVDSTFWVYAERLFEHGVVNGYPCGAPGEPCPGLYYRPQDNITREQFVKLDALAAGFTDPIPPTRQSFNDVPPASVFWIYIERLSLHNVMSGYACGASGEPCPGTYFRPGNNVTRGQASKIVSNTFSPGCETR